MKSVITAKADVLVIGGGGAGLRAAIEARRRNCDVLVVSKSRAGYGNNTAVSGAAFAAATGMRDPRDSPDVHLRDTVFAGCFLNDQRLVEIMAGGAGQQVKDLEEFGVKYKRRNGGFLIAHVPGHTYPRHVMGDTPLGIDLSVPLLNYALASGVRFAEGILVTSLLKQGNTVAGALGLDKNGNAYVFSSRATVLAAGGAGEIYQMTNNAPGSTGDGYILAYDAGAQLQDMEFIQFYPTALGETGKRLWPYELFIGRGATLRNASGEDILERHGIKDFARLTRDTLTRAIMLELIEGRSIGGTLAVDLSPVPEDKRDKLFAYAREHKYPEKPYVTPTAHFMMGGVKISERAETGIDGLYAAGEVCGGVHGANRLAGNALTEAFVFGAVAGNNAAQRALCSDWVATPQDQVRAEIEMFERWLTTGGKESASALREALRQTMWYKAGIIRRKAGLEEALANIVSLNEGAKLVSAADFDGLIQALKLRNMVTLSEMIVRSALLREESRGAHYRTDLPKEDNGGWLKNIVVACKDKAMVLSISPVNLARIEP